MGAVAILAIALEPMRWEQIGSYLQDEQFASAFDSIIISNDRLIALIGSLVTLLCGVILLCWPPRATTAVATIGDESVG